jgi:hypothetical protein
LAIAALVLGIGAFFISLIPVLGFSSIPFAITGLALGVAGIVRAKKGFEGMGLSITGVVACVAALAVSAVYLFAIGNAVSKTDDNIDGKCVSFNAEHTRVIAKNNCNQSHDGKVVGVVADSSRCPEAADGSMRLKADDSKVLCVDLDQ